MAIANDFSPVSKEALDCALALFPRVQPTVIHAYEDTLHGLLPTDRVKGPLADRHRVEMKSFVNACMAQFVESALHLDPS